MVEFNKYFHFKNWKNKFGINSKSAEENKSKLTSLKLLIIFCSSTKNKTYTINETAIIKRLILIIVDFCKSFPK
jgi:hypothetical protein